MNNQDDDPWGVRPLDDNYTGDELKEKAKASQARVASDGITQNWPKKDQKGNPDVVEVKEFVGPLRGMINMQVSRDRPVTGRSMLEALRYERNSAQLLRQVAITARPVNVDFFGKSDTYTKALRAIRRRANGQYSNMFENTREANFFVLLCGFEDNTFWVAIIMHLSPQEEGNVLADYISIIDPYRVNRARRRIDIVDRLGDILSRGNIDIAEGAYRDTLTYNDIPDRYGNRPTGLVVFAILCEFFRRVAVAKFIGRVDDDPDLATIFGPFQMNYNFDAYRRRMASACAQQAIEMSKHQGRLAIELPGYNENDPLSHDAIAVAPPVFQQDFNSTSSKGQSGAKPPGQAGNSGNSGGGDAGPSGSGGANNPILLDEMDGVELDENNLRTESMDDVMELDNAGVTNTLRTIKLSYEAMRKPKPFSIGKVLGGVKKGVTKAKQGVTKVKQGIRKQPSRAAKSLSISSLARRMALDDQPSPDQGSQAPQIPPVNLDPTQNFPQGFLK